jgi:hypothetical protein
VELELIVQDVILCYGEEDTIDVKLVRKSDQTPYEVKHEKCDSKKF